ncbi:MAG: acetylornithine transaminase [Actinomycetales bacterium]
MDSKMRSKELKKRWESAMQSTYTTPGLLISSARGSHLKDSAGNEYLDLLGGIATNALGHNHPKIVSAVTKQIRKFSHLSNIYGHQPGIDLAEKLIKMTGDDNARVYFCNSGTEAVEAAIKLSRLTGRKQIISAIGSFHGRTMGSLSLTAQPSKQRPFLPLLPKVKHVAYGDLKSLRKRISKKTAMVILEPIMGEAGVVVPPAGYLKAVRELCDKFGVLLVFDCVQTGMGRTGTWFGYEDEGIKPDVITIAKGIGGGLPLGAMITIGIDKNLFLPGSHGSTFGGNPIACAAANAVISEISKKLLLTSNRRKGQLFIKSLQSLSEVKEARGKGLLVGIEFHKSQAKIVAKHLEELGYLVNAVNESVLRLAPSYLITDLEIKKFVQALKTVLEGVENG